jgi:Flp pilus assembly pilin Flp
MGEEKVKDARSNGSLARDERGLSTVEYIIILVLIAVAGIGLWRAFGDTVSGKIGDATGEVGGL